MKNCTYIQWEKTIENNSLLKRGEIRFEVVQDADVYSIGVKTTETLTAKIIGESGIFVGGGTEKTIAVTNDPVFLQATKGSVISILNKYAIKRLYLRGATLQSRDIASLNYMDKLEYFGFGYGGELSEDNKIAGNFDDVILNPEVLYEFNIMGHRVTGNINKFLNYPLLTTIMANGCPFSGNIESIQSMTRLKNLYLDGAYLSGDLAKLPSVMEHFIIGNKSRFTWGSTSDRPTSATIFKMTQAHMGNSTNVDNAIINLANCTAISSPGGIAFTPSRTSESDSAVATLQSRGYTIIS